MKHHVLLCAAVTAACHTGSSNTWGSAVVMTSLAAASSVANRAAGGCYGVCQQGERCNEKTGLCEALPCRGQCLAGETCDEGFFGVKCHADTSLSVSTSKTAPAPPPPEVDRPAPPKEVPDAAKP